MQLMILSNVQATVQVHSMLQSPKSGTVQNPLLLHVILNVYFCL